MNFSTEYSTKKDFSTEIFSEIFSGKYLLGAFIIYIVKGPRETPTVHRWVPSCGTSPSGSHPGSAPPPVLQARPCPGVEQLHDSLPRIHSIPLGGRKAVAFTVRLYESEPDIKPDDIYIATSIGEEL